MLHICEWYLKLKQVQIARITSRTSEVNKRKTNKQHAITIQKTRKYKHCTKHTVFPNLEGTIKISLLFSFSINRFVTTPNPPPLLLNTITSWPGLPSHKYYKISCEKHLPVMNSLVMYLLHHNYNMYNQNVVWLYLVLHHLMQFSQVVNIIPSSM